MLKLAVLWGFIEKNPAVGIRKAQENNERHRYLADEEIARFIEALRTDPNPVAAAFFAFLLYTGVRQGKVYCSEMTAREEAEFYLDNCPGTKMDGDGDGVPCENQF